MAYLYEAWERDGKTGEAVKASLRSDDPAVKAHPMNLQAALAAWARDRAIVRITRNRTEAYGKAEKLVWLRPGYVDPF